MRSLALTYPDDPRAVARDDEYLLGPDLLVAPVLTAGATTRRLYLPKGRWIDLWRSARVTRAATLRLTTPHVLQGGQDVTVPAPLDQLPLFVRAHSALRLLPARVASLYGRHPVARVLLAWRKRVRVPRRRWSVQMAYGRRVCRAHVRARVIRACAKAR